MNLIVIAKAPRAGHSKTRLCPPCSPQQAADLAEAALRDTLEAVRRTPGVARRVLVLDGDPGRWLPEGFEVVPQRGDGLDQRIAAAFTDVGGPALLIGMDTPQVTADLLLEGHTALSRHQAVLGPAPDGGYWAIGLRTPDDRVFLDVPMSSEDTYAAQRERLASLDLRLHDLPSLRDVDRFPDALAVARDAPRTCFAAAVADVAARIAV